MSTLKQYSIRDYRIFIDDMIMNGMKPYHYVGRNDWQGPAVVCDRYQSVMSATSVKCQYDSMGHGKVVYPVRKDFNIIDMPYERQYPLKSDLRITHIPQVPPRTEEHIFHVPVNTLQDALKIYDVLTAYDLFQYDQNIKPDFCNACFLEMYNGTEWETWYNDETGEDFQESFHTVPENMRVHYILQHKS